MPRPAPAPDFEPQRALAAALPGASEDVKWGSDLVYSIGGRMFCVFMLEGGRARTCSFKVDDERFLELTGVPGVILAIIRPDLELSLSESVAEIPTTLCESRSRRLCGGKSR